jgi:hypothetical protein
MSTTTAKGQIDPPQISTNVVGYKRLRHRITLVASSATLTVSNVRGCLPITTPEIRITKLSVWASASAGSFIRVVFPISTSTLVPVLPGDNSVWTDEGTQGSIRPQVHLTPNFDFRNYWITAEIPDATALASFTGLPTDTIIVDVTVQYRSAVQGCPSFLPPSNRIVFERANPSVVQEAHLHSPDSLTTSFGCEYCETHLRDVDK